MKGIVLLHGWGHGSYSRNTTHSTPWHNKQEFVTRLGDYFEVHTPIFPGFCGESEPRIPYNLNDYARFIDDYIKANNITADCIIGNSFGGEVAVRYKTLINPEIPIVLIVPAILRKTSKSKKFIKTPKMLKPLRDLIRDLYIIHVQKTPEMKYGTRFLRKSYQEIARCDLVNEVKTFNPEQVLVLLGSNDHMINTAIIDLELSEEYDVVVINGGHELVETNVDEILSSILDFTAASLNS